MDENITNESANNPNEYGQVGYLGCCALVAPTAIFPDPLEDKQKYPF